MPEGENEGDGIRIASDALHLREIRLRLLLPGLKLSYSPATTLRAQFASSGAGL